MALEVIAHRGAQAQRPENTLAAEQLAQKMGADWLEADLISTKDHQLILGHDLFLETTTDIATRFPTRARKDGHFYAIDFSLAELLPLKIRQRVGDDGKLLFPNRKVDVTGAHITTLDEFLSMPNGKSGFYLEVKSPRWHHKNGADVSKLALAQLAEHKTKREQVWLQCFDPDELKRLHGELRSPFRQTQLMGLNSDIFGPDRQKFDFDAMRTPEGLRAVKSYADAIGPRLNLVIQGLGSVTPLVEQAHEAGLQVHPYTFQTDRAPFGPPLTANWIQAFERAHIEAVFTDQPDVVLALREPRN